MDIPEIDMIQIILEDFHSSVSKTCVDKWYYIDTTHVQEPNNTIYYMTATIQTRNLSKYYYRPRSSLRI